MRLGIVSDIHRHVGSLDMALGRMAAVDEALPAGAGYVIHGHRHRAMTHHVSRVGVINQGTAGQPRDPWDRCRSSYAVLETRRGGVTFDVYDDPVHRPYDMNA